MKKSYLIRRLAQVLSFFSILMLVNSQSLHAIFFKKWQMFSVSKANHKPSLYVSTSMDGAIFSSAYSSNSNSSFATVRLSGFLNYGCVLNLELSSHMSVFTGIGVKNVGFIEKRNDSTTKFRTYNIGMPLGVKIGNIEKKVFVFFGFGEDLAANYKEKSFSSKDSYFKRHKTKFSEWFSDRTPLLMPYFFLGAGVGHNLTFKFQYYYENFFNDNFSVVSNGVKIKPYSGYLINLFYLTLGVDLDYGLRGKRASMFDESAEL